MNCETGKAKKTAVKTHSMNVDATVGHLNVETIAVQHTTVEFHDGSLGLVLHHHVLYNTHQK